MAHEGLWEQLLQAPASPPTSSCRRQEWGGCGGLERSETAQRAKCQYLKNPESYVISLLNTEYVVSLSDRKIYSIQAETSPVTAGFLQQLCILSYLINAQDLPLADKLVKAETLPGGQFFFRGLHSLPTAKLEKAFGDCLDVLYRTAEQFDAKRCEFGDASIQLYMLPRIPLTIVIWAKDEQFQARASILFDQTAAFHMPLDALWAAVNLTVDMLVKTATGNN